MSRQVIAVGDESPQCESCRVLHADGLGQHHASRLAPIDEHSPMRPVLPQAVVHVLDENTHREHDESSHQPCEQQFTEADDSEPVVCMEEEAESLNNHNSKQVGRCNAVQVGKAGLPHDSTVGVE